jgi:nitrous oxidase accessory protein
MSRRIAILLAALLGVSPVSPAVGLQERIDAARPGDTLRVGPGTYEGNLLVAKRLTLLGEGFPVLHGDSTGIVLAVHADSCVVAGFVVERSGDDLMREDAGIFLRSSHNVIRNNRLRDVLFGIYLLEADSNLLEGNTIVGRPKTDVGQRGSGVHIWNSHHNRFLRNTVTGARDGFYIQYAHHTRIEQNDVYGLRYGVHYMYADSNVFTGNLFTDNAAGAAIMYSRGIRMRRNTFRRNRGFSSFGILFQDCHGMIADSNVVTDNAVGMFFESTTDNHFRHNVIARNDVALQMFQNSVRNTFTENNFLDNLSPLVLVGKRTESSWSGDGRGNYWSGYAGYDLDGDGIGDVPMNIQNVFQYLEGRTPNLRLYLYSPASQALAAAAEAFPIIASSEERDAHPLMRPVPLGVLAVPEPGAPTAGGAGVWLAASPAALLLLFLLLLAALRTRRSRPAGATT